VCVVSQSIFYQELLGKMSLWKNLKFKQSCIIADTTISNKSEGKFVALFREDLLRLQIDFDQDIKNFSIRK